MLLNSFNLRSGLNMRNPRLEAFTVYLFFVITQVTTKRIVCRNCEGYQICGLKTPQTPDCPNGLPCTKEQYQLCTKIIEANQNEKCDRPGVFAESASPDKFYSCKVKDKNFTFEKKSVICSKNTTFDQSTMRCLTESEKSVLEMAKELTVRYRANQHKFHCIKSGTFPDLSDCKMYHVCNSKLESQNFYCPSGAYFNGINCTKTKTRQCMQQLQAQFYDQISQAGALYRNVKDLVTKTSTTYQKDKNSAYLIAPGIIKRTFFDENKTKYTYYGIKKSSNSSVNNNTDDSVHDFEKFVENILAQFELENNNTLILSELKSASKNITGINFQNMTLITSESGRKLCKSAKKSNNLNKPKKNITVNKVTIILISQKNCESRSFCQTTVKPLIVNNLDNAAIHSPEREPSGSSILHLETNSTLIKASTLEHHDSSTTSYVNPVSLDVQYLYDSDNTKPASEETKTTEQTYFSKSPQLQDTTLMTQEIHHGTTSESPIEINHTKINSSRYSDIDPSVQSTEATSSDQEFSTTAALQSEKESTILKSITYHYSDSDLSDQSIKVTSLDQEYSSDMRLSSETEITSTKSSISQYSKTNSTIQSPEVIFAAPVFSSSIVVESRTEAMLTENSTSRYSGTDSSTPFTETTSSEQEFSSNSALKSGSDSHFTMLKSSTNLNLGDDLTTHFTATTFSDRKNSSITALEPEAEAEITLTTTTNEYFGTDLFSQHAELISSEIMNEEYINNVTLESETEANLRNTSSYPSSASSELESKSSFSEGYFRSTALDSELESTFMKASTSHYSNTNTFTQLEDTVFPNQEISTSSTTGLEIQTSFTTAGISQNADINSFPQSTEMSSADQIYSNSALEFETDSSSMKTNTNWYPFMSSSSKLEDANFETKVAYNTPILTETNTTHLKSNIIQNLNINSSSHLVQMTVSDHEYFSTATFKQETETTLTKESNSQFAYISTSPQNTESISVDQEFSSSTTLEPETENKSTKTNTSQYYNIDSFVQSTETTFADQSYPGTTVLESETEAMSTKASSSNQAYSGGVILESITERSSMENSFNKNPYNNPPSKLETVISSVQGVSSSTTLEYETETTLKETSSSKHSETDLFSKSAESTSSDQEHFSNIALASDGEATLMKTSANQYSDSNLFSESIKTTSSDQVYSSSVTLDAESGTTIMKASASQHPDISEGNKYSLLKDLIPNTTAESEWAPDPNVITTIQPINTSASSYSRVTTFVVGDLHHSSTLEPESTVNSTVTSPFPEISTSNKTTLNHDLFYSTTFHEKDIGSTLPKTSTSQYTYISSFLDLQETKILDLNRSTTLKSETTNIPTEVSNISVSLFTKTPSLQQNSYSSSTIVEGEAETLIENITQGNSASFYSEDITSPNHYSHSNTTQKSETEILSMKTNINTNTNNYPYPSSPHLEFTTSVIQAFQSSSIVESKTGKNRTSMSTPGFLETSKDSFIKSMGSTLSDVSFSNNVSMESKTEAIFETGISRDSDDNLTLQLTETNSSDYGYASSLVLDTTHSEVSTGHHLYVSTSQLINTHTTPKIIHSNFTIPAIDITPQFGIAVSPHSSETISADQKFSGSEAFESITETALSKANSSQHSYISTSPQFEDATFTDQDIDSDTILESETQISLMRRSTLQYSDAISSTHSTEVISKLLESETEKTNTSADLYINGSSQLEGKKSSPKWIIQTSTTPLPKRNSEKNSTKNLRKDSTKNLRNDSTKNSTKDPKKNSTKISKKKASKSFSCSRVGLFRDPKNCHSFYRCNFVPIKSNRCLFCKPKRWKLIATHVKCESGKWFSILFWRCVKFRPLNC